jgi:mercuric reductase
LAPQFVYVAAYQGLLAARNILNGPIEQVDHRFVPSVVFTEPQIAAVGLTRLEAAEAGYRVKASTVPIDAIPRALVDFQQDGVLTMVADANMDQVHGVQMVGSNAGDVIYTATLAVQFGMTVADLVNSFAPYLTMAEGLKLGALSFTRNVRKLSCCAA